MTWQPWRPLVLWILAEKGGKIFHLSQSAIGAHWHPFGPFAGHSLSPCGFLKPFSSTPKSRLGGKKPFKNPAVWKGGFILRNRACSCLLPPNVRHRNITPRNDTQGSKAEDAGKPICAMGKTRVPFISFFPQNGNSLGKLVQSTIQ